MQGNRDSSAEPAGPLAPDWGNGSNEAQILPMRASDLAEIVEIERACFADPWSPESFAAELDAPPAHWPRTLRIGGRLAGYIVVWFVEDEAHLANLAIAPWARGRGHAQRLLEHIYEEAYLRGCSMIVLEVRVSNAAAIRLYERNRFVSGGIRKNYYSHPREDGLVMIRSLRAGEIEG